MASKSTFFNSFIYILYWLENFAISLLFCCFYLYFYFIYNLDDFFYFSLFFLHVPVAWLSSINYIFLVFLVLYYLIYKDSNSFYYIKIFLNLGLIFTFLTIFTGMLWGLPVWGVLFVWDARFITVLVLFISYSIYYILYYYSLKGYISYSFVSSVILFGIINLPLIKYSVEWWNTLHQVSSLTQVYSTVHFSVLIPLFIFLTLFFFIYILLLIYLYKLYYLELRERLIKYFLI